MTSTVARWTCAVVNVAYVVVLVYATHHPRPDELLPGVSSLSDKLLHVAAFGILGSLTTATLLAAVGMPRPAVIAGLFVVLALFAALDEATQPWFGRDGELLDWVFDCLGLAAGILVTVLAAAVALRLAASRRRSPASR